MEESFFYIAQGIYAIFGILALGAITLFIILIYKKISNLFEILEEIGEIGTETAESAKNIFTGGEKIITYSLYRLIKNIKSKKGEDDEYSC
jgi:hypothetical protein